MSTSPDVQEQYPIYSCNCLNVKITSSTPTSPPPLFTPPAADFSLLYVETDGIAIVHPHATLRTRARGPMVSVAGEERCSRYTTLTCLLCKLLVYRIHQLVTSDSEVADGPVLPTQEWVGQEILKSASGWIEVQATCLKGSDVAKRKNSERYSAVFSIVVPSATAPLELQVKRAKSPTPESRQYLSHMPGPFPPVPFIPTHTVFNYLAEIATAQSNKLRQEAQQQIENVVRTKVAEIEAAEQALREQVEIMWKSFKDGIQSADKKRTPSYSPGPTRTFSDASRPSSPKYGTPVLVRSFVPLEIPPMKSPSAQVAPRMSSLSASLATSSFHHPKATSDSASQSQRSHSPRSASYASSTTVTSRAPPGGAGAMLQFNRNTEAINAGVTYRYFLDIEEEMAKKRAANGNQPQVASTSEAGPSTSQRVDTSVVDAVPKDALSTGEPSPKGKRKAVTFIEPLAETKEQPIASADDEMVFDLEDEVDGGEAGDPSAIVLPLIEQPTTLRSPRHRRRPSGGGLPSFTAISVPSPGPLQSYGRSSDSSDEPMRHSTMPHALSPLALRGPASVPLETEEILSPQEMEIRQLLAANTPSHRHGWRKDGPAWQKFVGKRNDPATAEEPWEADYPQQTEGAIEESDDDAATTIPGSVPPIPISTLFQAPEPLSLASYRPQSEIPQSVERRRASEIRKALYRERGRHTSRDPGALDFIVDADENLSDDGAEQMPLSPPGTDRGRQRALKILQAGNEVPEAGMWRSLA